VGLSDRCLEHLREPHTGARTARMRVPRNTPVRAPQPSTVHGPIRATRSELTLPFKGGLTSADTAGSRSNPDQGAGTRFHFRARHQRPITRHQNGSTRRSATARSRAGAKSSRPPSGARDGNRGERHAPGSLPIQGHEGTGPAQGRQSQGGQAGDLRKPVHPALHRGEFLRIGHERPPVMDGCISHGRPIYDY
jgi:hypothetical protein